MRRIPDGVRFFVTWKRPCLPEEARRMCLFDGGVPVCYNGAKGGLTMCGRYFVDRAESPEDLERIIDALNRKGQIVKTGEIFPGDTVPVIANTRALTPSAFAMPWGYRSQEGRLIINARSETAAEKPLFRDGMARRRCLLPATSYFEWEKRGAGKVKYAIRPAETGLFYLAGLYRIEGDQPRCTVLTREPAQSIAFIHDRMPVLLPGAAAADWLNPRYDPVDVLRAAMTDVAFSPVEGVRQMMLGE